MGSVFFVANDILKQVVEVRRCNERIMLVRIVAGEEVISIISAYRPQVGLDEHVKRKFWDNLGDLIGTIPADEKVFIGRDFNGYIGKEAYNYSSVHGDFGYGIRNESGENLLEFALAKELLITNSIFRKKDEHLIAYKSSGHATQIDYCLVWKGDRTSCLDCKVVLGIEMPTQHRLLVLVFRMRRKIAEKKIETRKMIMWGRHKGEMATTLASKIKYVGYPSKPDDANQM